MRIAVVDSGVHALHPHVGGPVIGFGIRSDGARDPDYVDRIGHGTAVAAAIRERSPAAEILAIKVFWTSLSTDALTLAHAIEAAAGEGADIVNLSLGTTQELHSERLALALDVARRAGVFVVAAFDDGGRRWLPGALDGTIGVRVDWDLRRDVIRLERAGTRTIVLASGYPRDIPGVPRERNLKGVSFAVANATGLIAQALDAGPVADIEELFDRLARRVRKDPPRPA